MKSKSIIFNSSNFWPLYSYRLYLPLGIKYINVKYNNVHNHYFFLLYMLSFFNNITISSFVIMIYGFTLKTKLYVQVIYIVLYLFFFMTNIKIIMILYLIFVFLVHCFVQVIFLFLLFGRGHTNTCTGQVTSISQLIYYNTGYY